ncbi:hypothetical protein TrST_g9577 [Triparma strigata]|uniref:Uncharacterized protein n=1 Tax=Triparma strigata TaxID=1606541 RepID=A0A9W7BXM6_9STRA|nr:hypothetical protein TrST_g9577 [Triparma strigata]
MSRPRSKERKKKIVYAFLPLQNLLISIGCYIMSKWEEEAGMTEKRIFRQYSYNNFFVFVLATCFYPVVNKCFNLLSDQEIYGERQVLGHISNLFVQAAALLAPACFLFAEGTGCVHTHSYRGCYALIQSNFTVQVHLVLLYTYYLLFGFTIHTWTYDDMLNFTAPFSLIAQFMFLSLASLLAFAVFGMRPRDIDDNGVMDGLVDCGKFNITDATPLILDDHEFKCSDGHEAPPQFAIDATFDSTLNCQILIFALWMINYFMQAFYVYRESRKILLGEMSERSRRKQHRSDHVLEDVLIKTETAMVRRIESAYRVSKGDHDIRISRVYSDMAFLIIVFTFSLKIYLVFEAPELVRGEWKSETTVDQKDYAPSAYYNSTDTQASRDAGYWYAYSMATTDLGYIMGLIVVCGNLNKDTHNNIYRRVLEALCVIFLTAKQIMYNYIPGINAVDGDVINYILGSMVFSGMLLLIKAKNALIANYAPVELKKHIMNMGIVSLTQLTSFKWSTLDAFSEHMKMTIQTTLTSML